MPRNVLLLHVDQQRYDALGCCRSPSAVTPAIDRLAAEGCCCDRHVVSNPICMPSRASLLTGLYPSAHGAWCNGVALPRREFATVNEVHLGGSTDLDGPPTMADHLAAAGWATASFGKLHLQPNLAPAACGYVECRERWEAGEFGEAWHGPYYGFAHVDMTWGHSALSHGHYRPWLRREHPAVFARLEEQERERAGPVASLGDLYGADIAEELYHSAWTADRAIRWLREDRPAGRPFFAFVGFLDPHHPFTPPAALAVQFADAPVADPVDPAGKAIAGTLLAEMGNSHCAAMTPEERRFVRRYTDAMNHGVDNAVGRIVACLAELGLFDDTVICYTSDHGDFLGDHGLLRKNMVGSDALLRVPLVIRAPGSDLPARPATPLSNCDVFPTLCDLADAPAPAAVHGRSLHAIDDDHLAFAQCFGSRAAGVNFSVYDARFRYSVYPERGWAELYDHAADPGECRNLAADPAYRGAVDRLHRAIESHLLATVRPNLGRVCAW